MQEKGEVTAEITALRVKNAFALSFKNTLTQLVHLFCAGVTKIYYVSRQPFDTLFSTAARIICQQRMGDNPSANHAHYIQIIYCTVYKKLSTLPRLVLSIIFIFLCGEATAAAH
jgi:hypothetical protein